MSLTTFENPPESTATRKQSLGGKYLTFSLGSEEYAESVFKVREIIGMMDITCVPHAPPHIKGVVNLRGKIVPIADLRMRFGLDPAACTERTCIVVVQVNKAGAKVVMGILVDAVNEVLNISEAEIEDPPSFGENVATDCVRGIAKVKGTIKILLDLDRVLGNDLPAVQSAETARGAATGQTL